MAPLICMLCMELLRFLKVTYYTPFYELPQVPEVLIKCLGHALVKIPQGLGSTAFLTSRLKNPLPLNVNEPLLTPPPSSPANQVAPSLLIFMTSPASPTVIRDTPMRGGINVITSHCDKKDKPNIDIFFEACFFNRQSKGKWLGTPEALVVGFPVAQLASRLSLLIPGKQVWVWLGYLFKTPTRQKENDFMENSLLIMQWIIVFALLAQSIK